MGNKCDLEDKREVDEDDIRVYNFNNLLYMIFFSSNKKSKPVRGRDQLAILIMHPIGLKLKAK